MPSSASSSRPAGALPGVGPAAALSITISHPHVCAQPVRLKVLRRVAVFRDLDEQRLHEVDALMSATSFPGHAMLHRAEAPSQTLSVLAAGRAKSFVITADGKEVIDSLLAPGDLFGGYSALGRSDAATSVQALTDVCVLDIGTAAFRRILHRFPDVALRVIDELADQLAMAREASALLAAGTVQARVAATLDRLCDQFGTPRSDQPGAIDLTLPLTRADLAGLTGATVESVSRVMSSMQRDAIISTGRRWTTVLDRERLRDLRRPPA